MDFKRLQWGEVLAAFGGLLLAISLFVKCYETRPENPNANINNMGGPNARPPIEAGDGTYSIWVIHNLLRFLFLAAAIAPIILVYIIARDIQLSWPRGELTAVVGLTALTLLFYVGIIDRPGEPSGQIELEIGWYGAMLGAILMAVGGAVRSSEVERKRKPPGVL